jgi:hypothetical protein
MNAYPGADDTSRTESYDLRMHADGTEIRVEVKGTLGAGDCILLTANEVANAMGSDWRTDLFVVSNIQLTEQDGEFIASGGSARIIRGWIPSAEDLTPTQYRYKIPD